MVDNAANEVKKFASSISSTACKEEAERIERMTLAVAEQGPPWATPIVRGAAPFVGIVGVGAEVLFPYLVGLGHCTYRIYLRLPHNAVTCIWGLGKCFFGGRFAVTIAAIEAFHGVGADESVLALQEIGSQLNMVRVANVADDKEDLDNDGIPDVQQIGAKQLAERKGLLVLRTVDAEKLSKALGGLWLGYVGVMVTLKVQFAQTVALAQSIASCVRPTLAKIAGPPLVTVIPKEYHQWISPCVKMASKIVASIIAWKVQLMISTFQSGLTGGVGASQSLFRLLGQQHRFFKFNPDSFFPAEILGWLLAGSGIYVQLFKGGVVPEILSPFFWPIDIFERVLQWNVTWWSRGNGPALADK
eukprot:CAMPEP_0194546068 /NCGR_PEP_ID=MMETSP0253-20130528/90117_1 /TAXON_ID=2966 /ORGANISM="Noctiluca scintillans" /LENGTH=358 /DNA_ID=CAMNT_0039393127 /DNA_START=54 /DNA_END=1130 /DNA_ORIENTATION=-